VEAPRAVTARAMLAERVKRERNTVRSFPVVTAGCGR
jgi:hypothetical protein